MDSVNLTPDTPTETITFVAFDLETTGINPSEHEIIEFGAVKFTVDGELDEFSSLCKPLKEISKEAQEVNNITASQLASAPPLSRVLSDFLMFQQNCVLVAHNLRFDLSFIREASISQNIDFAPHKYSIDTLALCRRLIRGVRYSLGALCAYFEIELVHSHRALHDARACKELLLKCIDKQQIMGTLPLKELLV